MKRYGNPKVVVTDKCPSYRAAMKMIGSEGRQETGRHLNNRAENSHLPFRRRERAMSRFRRMRSLQKFASIHSSVYNHFNHQRNIESRARFKSLRDAALLEWREFDRCLRPARPRKRRLVRVRLTAPLRGSRPRNSMASIHRPSSHVSCHGSPTNRSIASQTLHPGTSKTDQVKGD
jgi:hypothetical protein